MTLCLSIEGGSPKRPARPAVSIGAISSVNTRSIVGTLMILAIVAMPSSAFAQLVPQSSNEPLDITSDRFEGENDLARSTFVGNVRVVQGEAILTSDRLVLVRDANGDIASITALGGIRYSTGEEAITGETAVYDGVARTITISGDVLATQGDQIMAGGRLVYWVDSKEVKFTASTGGRVRGIFRPQSARPGS